jgi:hypothetical protein
MFTTKRIATVLQIRWNDFFQGKEEDGESHFVSVRMKTDNV